MNLLRLFIAADPESEIVERIEKFTFDAGRHGALRWLPAENYHLTLKFIGGTQEDQVPAIFATCREVAKNHEPFQVSYRGTGVFPNIRSPRVFWVGVNDSSQQLAGLAQEMDLALGQLGLAHEERSFSPHLTIAKSSRFGSQVDRRWLKEIFLRTDVDFGISEVRGLVLYQSHVTSKGSTYEAIERFRLGSQELKS